MSSITAPVDDALASALCTKCGLCCTGALHDFAVLRPEEITVAGQVGLTLRTEGRPGFALPCPKLCGTSCSIYEKRPIVCAGYRCALLKQLKAGSIEFEAAIATVAEAMNLFEKVRSESPDSTTIPMARAMIGAPPTADSDPDTRQKEMRLRLAITALSMFLDRHFRKSSEGNILSLETIADDQPDRERNERTSV